MPIEKCPHCGNIVEGKKIKSYTNKVARQGAKSSVHMATSAGGMATGAAIGSAVLPGVGTVVGGALGFIGSAMFNQKVNENIDKVGDKIEDEFISMDYEFVCPKCGHSWEGNDYDVDDVDEDDFTKGEEYFKDDFNRFFESYDTIMSSVDSAEKFISYLQGNRNSSELMVSDYVETEYDFLSAYVAMEYLMNKLESVNYNWDALDSEWDACFELLCDAEQNIDDALEKLDDEEYRVLKGCIRAIDFIYGQKNPDLGKEEFADLPNLNNLENNFIKVDYWKYRINQILSNGHCFDNQLSQEEEEYISELRDILVDGEISSRERRLLEKIRTQLGISEARAAELEASLAAPSLSPEELEYFNEYKEIVAEGEISARDRRYLDKLKSVNGISDARAKEIEGLL